MHSTASDGADPPQRLPQLAVDAGLTAIALTDHDTAAGVRACAEAAAALGLDFLAGIELSADPSPLQPHLDAPRGTLHLLGYGIDPDAPHLLEIQQQLLRARADRNPEMIARLNDLGVNIAYDEVLAVAGGQVVGRPHIAQVMVRKGYVKSIHEAFARYIGQGAAAYTRRDQLSPADAIAAIHDAGGLAVLAHPTQLELPDHDAVEHAAAQLKALGLDGIETRHPDHAPSDTARFEAIADRLSLLATGGSDYHGSSKPITLGATKTPRAAFDRLRNALT